MPEPKATPTAFSYPPTPPIGNAESPTKCGKRACAAIPESQALDPGKIPPGKSAFLIPRCITYSRSTASSYRNPCSNSYSEQYSVPYSDAVSGIEGGGLTSSQTVSPQIPSIPSPLLAGISAVAHWFSGTGGGPSTSTLAWENMRTSCPGSIASVPWVRCLRALLFRAHP